MNTRLSSKAILVIGIIIALVVGGLAYLGRVQPVGSSELTKSVEVPRTFVTSAPYAEDTLVTTNGRSFIAYNYVSGKVNLLSPDSFVNGLVAVDTLTVSDDGNFLLYHSELNAPDSAQFQALTAANLDTSQGYWWVYNVKAQTFRPLPKDVVLAKLYKNQVHAIRDNGTAESIATYDPASMQQTQSIDIPRSSDFLATEDGFLLQTAEEQISLTTDGIVSKTVTTESTTMVAYDAGKNVVVGVRNNENSQELIEIDLTDFSSDIIARGTMNKAAAGDNKVTYTYQTLGTEGTVYIGIYDIAAGKNTEWDIKKIQNEKQDIVFTAEASLDGDTAILSSSSGAQFLVGNELADIKRPDPFPKEISINGIKTAIVYDSSMGSFVIEPDVTNAAGMSVVYQQLDKEGFNPFIYGIEFVGERRHF